VHAIRSSSDETLDRDLAIAEIFPRSRDIILGRDLE
jgi:hypothetical protein